MTHTRRSLLFMPGDDRRKIEKALSLAADSICMDLEDGVALDSKATARAIVAEMLQAPPAATPERLVRINPIGSGLEADDLAAALPAGPEGIVLPKVESPEQVRRLAAEMDAHPEMDGAPIIALIETSRGLVNLPAIAATGGRLEALAFGAEDYAGDVGATRTAEGWEVLYARSAVVAHAAAHGLQAIDMVYVDFRDEQGLEREAEFGRQLGYDGKQAIHPRQLAPIHRAFTPTPEQVAQARRIVDAFAEHTARGTGAFALDGKMVDMPVVRVAENTLAKARAAGLL